MWWRLQTLAWAGWWLVTPTLPMLGPNFPLNGRHLRASRTTPSPSSLMSGVSNTWAHIPSADVFSCALNFYCPVFDPVTLSSLQHSGCCCGKLPHTVCLHTLALTCLRSMTSWRKDTAWSSLRDVHLKSTNSWEHVSGLLHTYLTSACTAQGRHE